MGWPIFRGRVSFWEGNAPILPFLESPSNPNRTAAESASAETGAGGGGGTGNGGASSLLLPLEPAEYINGGMWPGAGGSVR